MPMVGYRRRVDVTAQRVYKICGFFTIAATPVLTGGRGVTVAKTSAGIYTITLQTSADAILSAQITPVSATPVICSIGAAPTLPVASLSVLSINTAAAATDASVGYYFELTLSESQTP